MIFFRKKSLEISTSLQEITDDSVILVTKEISSIGGTYKVYINGWKYNLHGLPISDEDRLKIDSTYFKKGVNSIEIITRDKLGNEKTYVEDFSVV